MLKKNGCSLICFALLTQVISLSTYAMQPRVAQHFGGAIGLHSPEGITKAVDPTQQHIKLRNGQNGCYKIKKVLLWKLVQQLRCII